MSIDALNDQERPQERLERLGSAALSDSELLALVLRSGMQGCDVLSMSQSLLKKAGSLGSLASWTLDDFRGVKGVGPVKAVQLSSILEISRRVQVQASGENPRLETADEVAQYMEPVARGLEVEKVWTLCLSARNRLVRKIEVSSGTANSSLAHPREVYREAIRSSALSIVLVHNHPSGDPSPSTADITLTRQIRESGRILNIGFLDHVILGRVEADPAGRGYFSFRASGML
jgi:DNA repair protein RadC